MSEAGRDILTEPTPTTSAGGRGAHDRGPGTVICGAGAVDRTSIDGEPLLMGWAVSPTRPGTR
ncbi:hypothetical protein SCOCK_30110 [Actinacidiphila cocklensis]|uniref:Uncharacterized protein n=1 Tax=Actinacidiphila cocklensis TaxID=887465 RepID=A0A9W4GTP8_9ACTN|nr:hypothetical protein SCOCK_30110 [Actinacidiphila cocklensis]